MPFLTPHLRRVGLTGLVGLSLVWGCSHSAGHKPIEFSQNEWVSPSGNVGVQIVTEHYDLRVTSRDVLLQQYLPRFMETAFEAYSSTIQPSHENTDRMVIYLFGTRDEWAAFTRVAYPAQAEVYLHLQAGGYTDQPSATAVTHDLGRDRCLSLLAHEGFHQYVARHLKRALPAWLNEGLACQWEGFKLVEGRPVFSPKQNFLRRNSLRAALTGKDTFIPLPKLLAMDAGEAVVHTGQVVQSYYAQVWALVLFLQHGANGEHAKAFRELLADAGTDRLDAAVSAYRAATPDAASLSNGEIIFRHYITDDLESCGNDYFKFARKLVF
ncbi:MAG TPA: hypothetical protein PLL20_13050 [Phycisphaerae bacterium]|nr:hypothetical protein [Phycisphaerae bacterium]HRR84075.1 hypothetical protein [Phycisphaerae bacterium]